MSNTPDAKKTPGRISNLRAMFEQGKSSPSSGSPTPAESFKPKPLGKIKTSFVAIPGAQGIGLQKVDSPKLEKQQTGETEGKPVTKDEVTKEARIAEKQDTTSSIAQDIKPVVAEPVADNAQTITIGTIDKDAKPSKSEEITLEATTTLKAVSGPEPAIIETPSLKKHEESKEEEIQQEIMSKPPPPDNVESISKPLPEEEKSEDPLISTVEEPVVSEETNKAVEALDQKSTVLEEKVDEAVPRNSEPSQLSGETKSDQGQQEPLSSNTREEQIVTIEPEPEPLPQLAQEKETVPDVEELAKEPPVEAHSMKVSSDKPTEKKDESEEAEVKPVESTKSAIPPKKGKKGKKGSKVKNKEDQETVKASTAPIPETIPSHTEEVTQEEPKKTLDLSAALIADEKRTKADEIVPNTSKESKPENKPELEPKAELKLAPESEARPEPEPEPKLESEPEPEPEPRPSLVPESQLEPVTVPEVKLADQAQTHTEEIEPSESKPIQEETIPVAIIPDESTEQAAPVEENEDNEAVSQSEESLAVNSIDASTKSISHRQEEDSPSDLPVENQEDIHLVEQPSEIKSDESVQKTTGTVTSVRKPISTPSRPISKANVAKPAEKRTPKPTVSSPAPKAATPRAPTSESRPAKPPVPKAPTVSAPKKIVEAPSAKTTKHPTKVENKPTSSLHTKPKVPPTSISVEPTIEATPPTPTTAVADASMPPPPSPSTKIRPGHSRNSSVTKVESTTKPKPRPHSAYAPTSASAAKTLITKETKPSSTGRSPSRAENLSGAMRPSSRAGNLHSGVMRPTSRASRSAHSSPTRQEARAPSRSSHVAEVTSLSSKTTKPIDNSLLARLSRPTASSASKQVDKSTIVHPTPHLPKKPIIVQRKRAKNGDNNSSHSGESEHERSTSQLDQHDDVVGADSRSNQENEELAT